MLQVPLDVSDTYHPRCAYRRQYWTTILGPYYDFHDYSLSLQCIIQLHVSDLPDLRFHMYGFMESWNHFRVLCRTKLEVKRSRMSLRRLMVWRCHDLDLVSSTCRCHGREDYADHVSRHSVRVSIEGRFGISIWLYQSIYFDTGVRHQADKIWDTKNQDTPMKQ